MILADKRNLPSGSTVTAAFIRRIGSAARNWKWCIVALISTLGLITCLLESPGSQHRRLPQFGRRDDKLKEDNGVEAKPESPRYTFQIVARRRSRAGKMPGMEEFSPGNICGINDRSFSPQTCTKCKKNSLTKCDKTWFENNNLSSCNNGGECKDSDSELLWGCKDCKERCLCGNCFQHLRSVERFASSEATIHKYKQAYHPYPRLFRCNESAFLKKQCPTCKEELDESEIEKIQVKVRVTLIAGELMGVTYVGNKITTVNKNGKAFQHGVHVGSTMVKINDTEIPDNITPGEMEELLVQAREKGEDYVVTFNTTVGRTCDIQRTKWGKCVNPGWVCKGCGQVCCSRCHNLLQNKKQSIHYTPEGDSVRFIHDEDSEYFKEMDHPDLKLEDAQLWLACVIRFEKDKQIMTAEQYCELADNSKFVETVIRSYKAINKVVGQSYLTRSRPFKTGKDNFYMLVTKVQKPWFRNKRADHEQYNAHIKKKEYAFWSKNATRLVIPGLPKNSKLYNSRQYIGKFMAGDEDEEVEAQRNFLKCVGMEMRGLLRRLTDGEFEEVSSIKAGDHVVVVGLSKTGKSAHYNGQHGVVKQYEANQGKWKSSKWRVKLDDRKVPINLYPQYLKKKFDTVCMYTNGATVPWLHVRFSTCRYEDGLPSHYTKTPDFQHQDLVLYEFDQRKEWFRVQAIIRNNKGKVVTLDVRREGKEHSTEMEFTVNVPERLLERKTSCMPRELFYDPDNYFTNIFSAELPADVGPKVSEEKSTEENQMVKQTASAECCKIRIRVSPNATPTSELKVGDVIKIFNDRFSDRIERKLETSERISEIFLRFWKERFWKILVIQSVGDCIREVTIQPVLQQEYDAQGK